ncbi:MAG TPA: hypothetical protein VFB72_12500 [Verrucomicrobiae bacterium]|nr:hypothetical protein [Verrucomicrobiae bacterium]
MRFVACLLLGGLFVAGCAGSKATTRPPAFGSSPGYSTTNKSNVKLIITPDTSPEGKVISVDGDSRWAVLNFPIGTVPPIGRLLNVYRQGLKVGEARVSGPQDDENTVADITTGNVRLGDEVRGD